MILKVRNGINHIVLHLLLKYRYQFRSRPRVVKCVVAAEGLCIRTGLIHYGKTQG
jgi:hypothetical protein